MRLSLFYLGQGVLTTNNSQVLNDIKNGNAYANAFVCSVIA